MQKSLEYGEVFQKEKEEKLEKKEALQERETVPSRKIPSVEQAYELFSDDPWKPLSEWAKEWDCSHERVRQLREQAGIPPISSIDHGTARIIIDRIRSGDFSLTVRNLYDDLPIGLEKFLTWMKTDPAIYLGVLEAQQFVKNKEWSPDEKQCKRCGELLPINLFDVTQKYKDGRKKICKNCFNNPSEKLNEIKKKQDLIKKLREKLDD